MTAFIAQPVDRRALGVAAVLHGLALMALLNLQAGAEPSGMPPTLTVSLHPDALPAPLPEFAPAPKAAPPAPVPVPAILAAPEAASGSTRVPPLETEPEPRQEALPEARPDPVPMKPAPTVPAMANPPASPALEVAAAPATASRATPALVPAPPQPPRFDADYLHNPSPPYPALSRRLREQGRVLLRVHVSAQGQPEVVELRESSGYARLDQAAREVVSRWRFAPARQGEKAVAEWVLVPIVYSLRS